MKFTSSATRLISVACARTITVGNGCVGTAVHDVIAAI